MIFTSSKELYKRFLNDIRADLPYEIYIFTYGIWAGIGSDGTCRCTTSTYHLLNWLNFYGDNCKTHIVVGYNESISEILLETAKKFKCLEFRTCKQTHSKCILTSTGIVSIGSSNFNDSSWNEINDYDMIDTSSKKFLELYNEIIRLNACGEHI